MRRAIPVHAARQDERAVVVELVEPILGAQKPH